MRICPQCGTPYYPNTIFCESCGAALRTIHFSSAGPRSGNGPGSGPLRAVAFEIAGSGRTVELQLTGDSLILGRADSDVENVPALDLSEDGGIEHGVSRRHARLLLKSDLVLIEDLQSANGTWVNDVRLPPNQPYPLRHGDLVRLGRLSMRINLLAGRW